ncbi:hypothetical protein [Runella slithyformis]|uniref:Uncharacterized protein n=1 Tax=Runella slithyformis (strain ATCC 29530 / DSM 19594 / LMG 11500 / NCIMB 11436 / LSU 4) TaxID=761193 RepID=A0A7U3ZPX5_RUNSL|nr:hypothetical protein [Runella slithyformis]AEI51207.1 hypothetical protein Runsl_4897 [Runella slithyformis DSM 19594]
MAANPIHPQRSYAKGKNLLAFLKAVPSLEKLNYSTILLLAQRFGLSPEMLALLLNIAARGGALYDN